LASFLGSVIRSHAEHSKQSQDAVANWLRLPSAISAIRNDEQQLLSHNFLQ
jgi:hypothetical protein